MAAGILLTRVLGFVRERVFAHYLGNGPAADAFRAALKIPNVLRNLLGEGTLSASFIPVYARLLERGDEAGARALAGAVLGLLTAASAVAALVGIALAPVLTDVVAFGFQGPTRELTIRLVRILFPMTGLMVVSGWCLGVLNSHRRFFLPYAAPAVWNIAGIAALWLAAFWDRRPASLAVALAWGTVAGSLVQVLIQLPACARLLRGLPFRVSTGVPGVREVRTAWLPVVLGAGVAQIASVVDTQLGSLAPGGVAALGYAQLLQSLPISLFGVAVAASALPELSREAGRADGLGMLRERLGAGVSRIAFYVLPMAVGYVLLGEPLVAALFETGRFGPEDTAVVAGLLAAYGVGLLAQAATKLLASGYYGLQDTRTPVRLAIATLVGGTALGYWFLTRTGFGVAGIAFGSALGAWAYAVLALAGLDRRLGAPVIGPGERAGLVRIGLAAVLAAGAGLAASRFGGEAPAFARAALAWGTFGVAYLAAGAAFGVAEARSLLQRVGIGRT
ncbi:MAG TPA: murein biosynthesis integral membrane protein MurJ [Gemmatimonadales bacterium]|nr:murein biosynthesis integral membrane protein MurJ [Gemmatimonadales bacterium]